MTFSDQESSQRWIENRLPRVSTTTVNPYWKEWLSGVSRQVLCCKFDFHCASFCYLSWCIDSINFDYYPAFLVTANRLELCQVNIVTANEHPSASGPDKHWIARHKTGIKSSISKGQAIGKENGEDHSFQYFACSCDSTLPSCDSSTPTSSTTPTTSSSSFQGE